MTKSAFQVGDLVTPVVAGFREDHRGEVCVVVDIGPYEKPVIRVGDYEGPYGDDQLRLVARPVPCPFCGGTGHFPAVPEGTKAPETCFSCGKHPVNPMYTDMLCDVCHRIAVEESIRAARKKS